jgi:hypothetical protein
MIGIKKIWLDNIANVDEFPMLGQEARKCNDLWLTQWKHLARPDGPRYAGVVL